MEILKIILTPAMGAAIGYFTNWLAIKMLFRPHRAHYLLGWHIPFTPGLMPKEKPQLAKSIGEVVGRRLLSEDILQQMLLSDNMRHTIARTVENYLERLGSDESSMQDFLYLHFSPQKVDDLVCRASQGVANSIQQRLSNSELGHHMADAAVDYLSQRTQDGFFGKLGASLVAGIGNTIHDRLANGINHMLTEYAPAIISKEVDNEARKLLNMRVCDIVENHSDELARLKEKSVEAYCRLVEEHLPNIINSIGIDEAVEKKINDMDIAELEDLVLQVMNKELKAIVGLGALLGFVMGIVTLLIQLA